MLRIYPSRYPDQASQALYQELKKSYLNGRRCYLVVPSQYTVEAEQELFAFLETDVLMQVQVKSFQSLTREILQEGRGYRRPVVDETGRAMLLRLILEDKSKEWEAFPPSTRREGLVQRLAKELREYKEYGISDKTLQGIADDLSGSSESQTKFSELAEIVQIYEDRLQGRFIDGDDQMRMAFDQVEDLNLFDNVDFFFNNFNSMSLLELDALQALLDIQRDLHMALTLDERVALQLMDNNIFSPEQERAFFDAQIPDFDAFSLSVTFFKKLQKLNGADLKIMATSDAPGKPDSVFGHGASSIFSFHPKKIDAKNKIRIYEYRNTEAEIDGLIVDIKKKIQKEKLRFKDIKIILVNHEEYSSYIQQKFPLEGLPFFMDERRTVYYHPFIRFILALLEIGKRNYRRDDVLNLLKTGFCGVDDEAVHIYQNFVERRKIEGWKFESTRSFTVPEDYIANNPREESFLREEYKVSAEVNERMLEITRDLVGIAKSKGTILDFAKRLYAQVSKDVVQVAINNYESSLEEANDLEQLEEHRQIWDAMMAMLDQLVAIGGDEEVEYSTFVQLVEEGVASIQLGVIPPYQDQIMVSGLLRSRTQTRKVVYFVGMGDIYIPQNQKSATILTQEEKNLLKEKGYFLPSMKDFAQEEEKLATFKAFMQIGGDATISYAIQNVANEPIRLSFWMKQLLAGFTQLQVTIVDEFQLKDQLYSKTLLSRTIPRILQTPHDNHRGKAEDILNAMKESNSALGIARAIETGRSYHNKRPALSPTLVADLYGKNPAISASQIESFAVCPYRYFLDYGVKLKEIRTIDIDARDLGNVSHNSIDRWTEVAAENLDHFRQLSLDESKDILLHAFDEKQKEILDGEKREEPRNRFILSLMSKTLEEANDSLYLQVQESDVGTILHEESFGRKGKLPGIELDLGNRKIYIEGRIDRVDIARDSDNRYYLQVVDYKSSDMEIDLTRLLGGLQLQLTIYMKAALGASKGQALVPVGCFYLPITPNGEIDEEKLEQVEKALAENGLFQGIYRENQGAMQLFDHTLKPSYADQKETGAPISILYRYKGSKRDYEGKDNVLNDMEFNQLIDESLRMAKEMMKKREAGDVSVSPYRYQKGRSARTGCEYCSYQSVCRFEKDFEFNQYRMIETTNWKTWREGNNEEGT